MAKFQIHSMRIHARFPNNVEAWEIDVSHWNRYQHIMLRIPAPLLNKTAWYRLEPQSALLRRVSGAECKRYEEFRQTVPGV